ncbi:MAG: helix-turn-helix transcriptional regulator [Ktedonobacteraceae bacterium]
MTESRSQTPARVRLVEARKRQGWSQLELAQRLGTTRPNVSRWESGATVPNTYFRGKLMTLLKMSAQDFFQMGSEKEQQRQERSSPAEQALSVPPGSVSSEFWIVPYSRNAFFTGRDELLHELHMRLSRDPISALPPSWALSGLSGIGKTQVALEYAYRYRHEYRAVFWVNAATQETLQSDLMIIAATLHLPKKDRHDHLRVTRAMKQWFASHQQWLLILDNVEDVTILQSILPTEHTGRLLLTTRVHALGSLAQRLEVEPMGMAEASLFLLRRARLLAPEASLDQAPNAYRAAAEAIAIELGFLPLALDQAGAHIEEVGCSPSTYLESYQTQRQQLFQRRGRVPGDHPEPVAETWSLSFEKIEQTNSAAAELLRLCAFLDPDAIPEELIRIGSAHLGPVLGPLSQDAFALDAAIQYLRTFSLLQRDPDARFLRLHPLVQAVLKDVMPPAEQRQWAERAVRATNALFPEIVEISTWLLCRRVLSQAQACSALIQTYALAFPEAASLLPRTACYLEDCALYEQAASLYQQALHIREHCG